MKKMISLAFAALMFIGASAQIRQSAQMTQEDAFTSAVAYNMKGTVSGSYTYKENDFNVMFYDAQNEIVAYVELIAPSATTLQGVYHLNDGYVNNMAIAKVYDQGNAYEMTGGDLIFICKGTQKQTVQGYGEVTYYIYDVQGLNWHNKSTGVNVMEFHGTVAMPFQSWKTKELYTMTETAISATEIVLDDVVGYQPSENGDYWEFKAFDNALQNGVDLVAFSNVVYTDAQDNGFYCVQGAHDINTLAVSNGQLLTQIFVNGAEVTSDQWQNFMAFIVETEPGSGKKFVMSLYLQTNNVWYHMTSVYDAAAAGVEEVEAAETEGTAKVMKDGQLIIIRNGVRYNAQGAVIE